MTEVPLDEPTTPEAKKPGPVRRIVLWVVLGLIALVLLLFAISNMQTTVLRFWPLPFELEAPLYLVTLILLIGGFLLGHLLGWITQGRWRRAARSEKRRAEVLQAQLDALRQPRSPSELSRLPPSSALVSAQPTL